jgi:hypothetical protein
MAFMTPPNASDLSTLRRRGAKIMVYHGVSDPIFSVSDTEAWYRGLSRETGGDPEDFARLYRVPGMGHCSGGPATDQADFLDPAGGLGRTGPRAGQHRGQRARCGQRRRRQCRAAGRLGAGPHAAAVPLPERGALQGLRQRRIRRQLALPPEPATRPA